MVNKVILVGNLGRDPEMGVTSSDRQWARFSLATNRRWNDRDGNKQEETEWHQVTCWGKLAEIVGQYLHKGVLLPRRQGLGQALGAGAAARGSGLASMADPADPGQPLWPAGRGRCVQAHLLHRPERTPSK